MENSPETEDLCKLCGHSFDNHLLIGHGEIPLEGWMECPVENCDCYRTWSMDENIRLQIEEYKREKGIE